MLLCALTCVSVGWLTAECLVEAGLEPQMRDLMKELFQLVFAGNEEREKQ
jgi:hypothetical protein